MNGNKSEYFRNQVINKDWIEKYVNISPWQRKLYDSRVNKFLKDIKNDNFFNGSLLKCTQMPSGEFRIWDGQHRLKAIENATAEFKFDLLVYSDLTEDEEIELYRVTNDQKAHSFSDKIKVYIGRNEIIDSILDTKTFPMNITLNGGRNSMRIDTFLRAFFNSKVLSKRRRTGLGSSSIDLFISSLDKQDFSSMKDFCSIYVSCFGQPLSNNWYHNMMLVSLMFRYYNVMLRMNLDNKEIMKRFRKIKNDDFVKTACKRTDSQGWLELNDELYKAINRSIHKRLWIPMFWLSGVEIKPFPSRISKLIEKSRTRENGDT